MAADYTEDDIKSLDWREECCRRGQPGHRPARKPHRPALRHRSFPSVPGYHGRRSPAGRGNAGGLRARQRRLAQNQTAKLASHRTALSAALQPRLQPDRAALAAFEGHYLAGYLTKSGQELSDKIYHSIRTLLERPDTIKSICKTHSE